MWIASIPLWILAALCVLCAAMMANCVRKELPSDTKEAVNSALSFAGYLILCTLFSAAATLLGRL